MYQNQHNQISIHTDDENDNIKQNNPVVLEAKDEESAEFLLKEHSDFN